MPALPEDIGRALRRAVIVEAADPAIKAIYAQARDGRTAPATGYFDDEADAATAMGNRLAQIGVVRRRFAVPVADVIFPDLSAGVPVWRLTDADNDVDGKHLVARLELDAENETTTMELYG